MPVLPPLQPPPRAGGAARAAVRRLSSPQHPAQPSCPARCRTGPGRREGGQVGVGVVRLARPSRPPSRCGRGLGRTALRAGRRFQPPARGGRTTAAPAGGEGRPCRAAGRQERAGWSPSLATSSISINAHALPSSHAAVFMRQRLSEAFSARAGWPVTCPPPDAAVILREVKGRKHYFLFFPLFSLEFPLPFSSRTPQPSQNKQPVARHADDQQPAVPGESMRMRGGPARSGGGAC